MGRACGSTVPAMSTTAVARSGCGRGASGVTLFFFQAEDGIRDGHVTGVQTCALPICPDPSRAYYGTDARVGALLTGALLAVVLARADARGGLRLTVRGRSEERRVGKEGGWRGAPCVGRTNGARLWEYGTGHEHDRRRTVRLRPWCVWCNPFFFSSRRRHTRWPRDWSSDVCSSDLPRPIAGLLRHRRSGGRPPHRSPAGGGPGPGRCPRRAAPHGPGEIGRASCRERGWVAGGAVRG